MKNILVPTDFSDAAKNAFNYAQSFADKDANLILLHAHHPQFDPSHPYAGENADNSFHNKEAALEEFIKENHQASDNGIITTPMIRVGLAGDVIVDESKKQTDLIVMGRTGSNTIFEKVFGTVSTQIAQHAHCPVLLVPDGADFKPIDKVLFATNQSMDKEEPMIKKLLSLIGSYEPEIHFVQIQNDIFNYNDLENEGDHYLSLLQENIPNLNYKVAKIRSNDVIDSLHRYAERKSIGLNVLATEHRGILEQLFHRSITKKMILDSSIPLLVMHY